MNVGKILHNNGDEEFYLDGKLHREDGPAVTLIIGESHYYGCLYYWCLDGVSYGKIKPDNWDELVKISRAKRLLEE